MSIPVPVFRPQLPDALHLLPYLRRIDASRIYTNWGPLVTELEQRLADHFRVPDRSVVCASSGTAALVGAILASAGRAGTDRPLAIVPALTFVATAIAVELCGYRPYVVDVRADSWGLDVERLHDHPLLAEVGLVVVAAPFGRLVLHDACLELQRRTGIPVVIDAAASFEALSANPGKGIGDVPVALSFHATKTFATGEGGCVVTTNSRRSTLVAQALNFGFHGTRNSVAPSINGKMSEYHAAVGLAELDGWPQKVRAFRAVSERYRERMDAERLASRFFGAPTVAGCYALFAANDPIELVRLQQSLGTADIEYRLWYGNGLLGQKHFADLPHDPLDVSEQIAPLMLGLPTATDLPDQAIDRVVIALDDAVRSSGGPG